MPKGKVIKVEYVDNYTGANGTLHNFAVLIEGDKVPYFISVKDKEKPNVSVGEELDFEVVVYDKTEDKRQHKFATINGNSVDLVKIKKNQPAGGFNGGFGGNKNQPQTPEQIKNGLVSYLGGYAKEIIIHRVNLGKEPKDIIAIYEELLDGFMKASVKHIK